MRDFCGYGLASPDAAPALVVAVCDVLGHGINNVATAMLLETAAQETHLGRFLDPTPNGAGRGLCQIDEIAFQDVIARTRDVDVYVVQKYFGVDVRGIEHRHLDYSPLLSFVLCRLFYKLIPEPFPLDLPGRASYWKRHYNTHMGKGTVGEYIKNAQRFCR